MLYRYVADLALKPESFLIATREENRVRRMSVLALDYEVLPALIVDEKCHVQTTGEAKAKNVNRNLSYLPSAGLTRWPAFLDQRGIDGNIR